MKKRSRWDQKSPPPSRLEDDNLRWSKWQPPRSSTPQLRNLDTQAPLDYSTESRNRAKSRTSTDHRRHAEPSEERNNFIEQTPQPMMRPHWPMYSNYPSYPSSSRGSLLPYPPPSWQPHGSYYEQNSHWWNPGRPPSNHFTPGNEYHKKDKKSYNSFYMNSRHQKEQPEYYNYNYSSKRYSNSKSHFDKPSKETQFHPSDNFHYQKHMFRKDSSSNFNLNSKYSGSSGNVPFTGSKDCNSLQSRRKDCSPSKLRKCDKFSGISKQCNLHSSKGKSSQISKSSAEQANSKAFDIAASNLREAYLATKTGKSKGVSKFRKTKGKVSKRPNIATNSGTHKTIPPCYMREFWDSDGNKGASTSKITRRNTCMQPRSLSVSETLLITDTESESGESDTSISESVSSIQNYMPVFSDTKLERRCSESCLSFPISRHVKAKGRIRSRSASLLEVSSITAKRKKDLKSTLLCTVKGIVAEHLFPVDKNQVSEVVKNSLGSAKFKQMIQSINNACGSHYAMSLCHERDNLQSGRLAGNSSNSKDNHDPDILPDDVIQQVREILDMEANGTGNSDWDEVTLSIADLISGSIIKNQSSFHYKSNHSGFLESEIEILTPPPKTPATMITLADSDTDFHPGLSTDASPTTKDLFNSSSISPEVSFMSLSPSPQKHKVQTPPPPFVQGFQCLTQPPTIKRSLSSSACPEPVMPTLSDDVQHDDTDSHLGDEETVEENVSLKQSVDEPAESNAQDSLCDIGIPSSLVQVKEERPSPISECGLCAHSARSPHTPQCGFSYGLATSPVHLLSGPPIPLASSAQRPVPRLPPDLSCIFKRENSEATTFLSLENIDRPSSEERPMNPAPPDTASTEPPSPLAIPSPQSTIHTHTSRQILFSDTDFIEPPRPPPPPPLEHSPPIKMERRTPTNSSFGCFYMRPDCERPGHSEFHRRPAHSQMREPRVPHLYPMEAPYIPNIRPRTPQRMHNLFPLQSPPRCIIPNRAPSPAANIRSPSHQTSALISIAVQTESISSSEDKSTNVNIGADYRHPVACNSNTNAEFFSEIDSIVSRVKSLDTPQGHGQPSFHQNLSDCEDQAFNYITLLEKQQKEMHERKMQLIEALRDLSNMRRSSIAKDPNLVSDPIVRPVLMDLNSIHVLGKSAEDISGKILKREACENLSVVSSSQEIESKIDRPPSTLYAVETETLENERCTSTSGQDMKLANDSVEDSPEFESFIKEEHTAPDFETAALCNGQASPDMSPKQATSSEFRTVPSSTEGGQPSDRLHIDNDSEVKLSNDDQVSGDDIIIMGDLSHRKMVLFSPLSPKTRNSSGSEHGYSLRSRGPPSESYDYNSDSNQPIKELPENEGYVGLVCSTPKRPQQDGCFNDSKIDDVISLDSSDIIVESCFKKKRKRKRNWKKFSKKKRRKCYDFDNLINLAYNHSYESPDHEAQKQHSRLMMPKQIESSIHTLKVAGKFIFTGCGDYSVRVYDTKTGELIQIYADKGGSVTSLLILGEPDYVGDLSRFTLVTGSDDRHIRIFDGKTANLNRKINATEPITCLEHRWKYVFIGTEKGYCIKWNLKDKKLGEKIRFCEQVITCILTHVEGGRKVLLVAAKSCNLMIRDAMSGLFLRSLEYAPFNVYTAIFEGNLLYAAGSDKNIYIYDFCSGVIKDQINTFSSISSLLLHSSNIVATCYDGFVRIINRTGKTVTHTVPVESEHKMVTCSFLYKNQIILGNKYGEVVSCNLPCE